MATGKLADLEKSQELADTINSIKIPLILIDCDYAREAAKQMKEQAGWQDSAAVLNPMYNPLKQDIIRKQADALNSLVDFVEALKEVEEMKKTMAVHDCNQQQIMKMFL